MPPLGARRRRAIPAARGVGAPGLRPRPRRPEGHRAAGKVLEACPGDRARRGPRARHVAPCAARAHARALRRAPVARARRDRQATCARRSTGRGSCSSEPRRGRSPGCRCSRAGSRWNRRAPCGRDDGGRRTPIVDLVQWLVDKSFVRQVGDERFDLLESVREYAASTFGPWVVSTAAVRSAKSRPAQSIGDILRTPTSAGGGESMRRTRQPGRGVPCRGQRGDGAWAGGSWWAHGWALRLAGPYKARASSLRRWSTR